MKDYSGEMAGGGVGARRQYRDSFSAKEHGRLWGAGLADWTALHLVCIGGYVVIYIFPNSENYTLRCIKWTVDKIC